MSNCERSHRISVADVELLVLSQDLRTSGKGREDMRRRRSGSSSEIVFIDDAEIREILSSRFGSREWEESVDGVERVGARHRPHEQLRVRLVSDQIPAVDL